MRIFNNHELLEIKTAKANLHKYYSNLLKDINKDSTVGELNRAMSDAQYTTDHYNNILNYDIERPHKDRIEVINNKHWYSDFQKVDDLYNFNWDKDFLEDADEYGTAVDGIITKPKALKDMHSWCNPYGGEWEYASDNYPHIGKDLPAEIKKVNKNPHYWLETVSRSDSDYLVKDLSYSTVSYFFENMRDLFADKDTVVDIDI